MISNWKNPFVLHGLHENISALYIGLRVNTQMFLLILIHLGMEIAAAWKQLNPATDTQIGNIK